MADSWKASIEWRAIPWTIKGYVALHLASYVFGLIRVIDSGAGIKGLTPGFWLYLIVSLVLIAGVIRRSRVAWIAALAWELWSFLPSLFLGMEPKDDELVSTIFVAVGLVLLVLLVHPLTRAWNSAA